MATIASRLPCSHLRLIAAVAKLKGDIVIVDKMRGARNNSDFLVDSDNYPLPSALDWDASRLE